MCSNVLVDDDPDNCDMALGSSPLKGLLCRISKAEAPERTVTAALECGDRRRIGAKAPIDGLLARRVEAPSGSC